MIPVIDRYLLHEVSRALAAFFPVLIVIVVSNSFIQLLERVAGGDINPGALFQLVGFQFLRYIPRLIPPAFFLAILFALGRLYRDSEMVALEACGVGPLRIYRSFLFSALPLALITAGLSLYLQPWATAEIQRIKEEQKHEATEVLGLVAGRFNEYSKGDLVFYIESFSDQNRMQNIFVQKRQHGAIGLVTADEGYQFTDPDTGDRYLVLVDGRRYEGTPGQIDYSVGEFEKYGVRIRKMGTEPIPLGRSATPTSRLIGSGNIKDRTELQYRISFPVAVIAFALLSIPLTRSLPRQGIYGRLFFAFLIYFVFLNLQVVSKSWMEEGITPEWLGIWWVYGVMLLVAAALLATNSPRVRKLLRRRSEGLPS